MKSFTQLTTNFTTLSRDSAAANLAIGVTLINVYIKKILVMKDWTFNRGSYADASVAEQQAYPLPYNCGRLIEIKVTPASKINYFPKEISSREIWTKLNRVEVLGDQAQKFFVEPDEVELYPVPATAGSTIKFYFQKIIKNLATANDYATGTITVTARSKDALGIGTTFTSAMVGRFITFDDDPYFYEIASFTDATHVTLKRETRLAITSGDYDIVEVIPLPDGYEDIPLWGALANYFQVNEDPTQAREYERMYKEGIVELERRDAKTTGNVMTKETMGIDEGGLIDINRWPQDIS